MTESACCSAQAQTPVHLIFFAMRLDQLLALGASSWLRGQSGGEFEPLQKCSNCQDRMYLCYNWKPSTGKEYKAPKHPGQEANVERM